MRRCPQCSKLSVSRTKLFFQAFHIPGVVAICSTCQAPIFFDEGQESVLAPILLEWLFFATLIGSLVVFSNMWVGFGVFLAWRVLRVAAKTLGPLKASV